VFTVLFVLAAPLPNIVCRNYSQPDYQSAVFLSIFPQHPSIAGFLLLKKVFLQIIPGGFV
jgi:hypothetical protein